MDRQVQCITKFGRVPMVPTILESGDEYPFAFWFAETPCDYLIATEGRERGAFPLLARLLPNPAMYQARLLTIRLSGVSCPPGAVRCLAVT